MSIFDIFRPTPEQKMRKSIRRGVEAAVKNAVRESGNDAFFSGMMVQAAIATYFDSIKKSGEFSALALMSQISGKWDAYRILEEEEKRAINKYLQ